MPDIKISVNSFKKLLDLTDLVVMNGSPYLHTWDYNNSSFISTKYEEDGLIYEIDILEEEVQDIKKRGVDYIVICDKVEYTINLYTLKPL